MPETYQEDVAILPFRKDDRHNSQVTTEHRMHINHRHLNAPRGKSWRGKRQAERDGRFYIIEQKKMLVLDLSQKEMDDIETLDERAPMAIRSKNTRLRDINMSQGIRRLCRRPGTTV
jgi:formylmethanofuran dehydrogenase subunit A